jgi:MFS family permease
MNRRKKMGRSIAAVLAGAVVWSFFYQLTFPVVTMIDPDIWEGAERVDHAPWLATVIALSVVYSVAAGYVTGLVGKKDEPKHALRLGVLQFALGITFEVMFWSFTPVWYHLVFLALLIPGNVYGGMLREKRRLNA